MRFFRQYEPLFSELKPRTLVLTPNQRMSRFVQAQYGLWRKNLGDAVWPSLNLVSLSIWVQNQWGLLQASAHPQASSLLLSAEQERLLWLQAIRESEHGYDLLADESMAELAAQAWRTLRLWRKDLTDLPQETPEQQLLCIWVKRFTALCASKNRIDAVTQVQTVTRCLQDDVLSLPEHIVLLGFDEMSPLDQHLLEILRTKNVSVTAADIRIDGTSRRLNLADTETEITSMARWAAALVNDNPSCSIGLVIPDLANLRARVTRILTQIFEPQAVYTDRSRHAPGFNISAAQPLAQTPLIAAALMALKLNQHSLEREQAELILGSPFIGDDSELQQRLQLLAKLRERYLDIPVGALRTGAGEAPKGSDQPLCPLLHRRLHQFQEIVIGSHVQKRLCSAWAEIFDLQLHALGWPGSRALDTLEFQQREHWPELLTQLAALDEVQQAVTLNEALNHLARLAYVPFHAQTRDSPVQVLGLLEAAGQQFDYLWVMGLDNRVWPEPSKPNPLLPVDLQRRWRMPRASSERELEIAQRLTERLMTSAPQVILSSPKVDGDQPLQASPLITHIPEVEPASLHLASPVDYKTLTMGQGLEFLTDEWAPPLVDVSQLRGGATVLTNQAACPFRAFAIHRLNARAVEPLEPGITPIVRGNLIHQALEILWRQLQTQAALLALSDAQLDSTIHDALSEAWRNTSGHERIGLQLKSLEQERAQVLIKAWLELEKQRPPFSVLFHEKAAQYALGAIPLTLRFDRIDELDDGSLLVIDYKTGSTDLRAWAGNRPDEPQVPLYTLAQGDRVQAAAYVQINAHEVGAKGIAVNPDILAGLSAPESLKRLDLPDTWQGIVEHWRETLTRLAEDFVRGDARVDPKKISETCRFCDLHSLCRIRSQIVDEELEDEL